MGIAKPSKPWVAFHGFSWNFFLFKFQNLSIERQSFVETVPRIFVETKFCLAVFGHIFVIIGMTTLLIERRNVENEFKKSVSRPPYRRHVEASFCLYNGEHMTKNCLKKSSFHAKLWITFDEHLSL